MSKNFLKIDFGYASAQQEGTRAPSLLIDGYLDTNDVSKNAAEGPEFLVLGYKGQGKSAIGERLRLLYQNDSQTFITSINLEDFPYATFSTIVEGKDAPQTKYPAAWSWLLLIYLLASFEKDAGLELGDIGPFNETISALKDMGLLPVAGLPRLVRTSSEHAFKVSIPTFFEGTRKTQSTKIDIPNYVENLKRLVSQVRTTSRHLVVLDGLDEIVTSQSAQWESLGALIFEANRLNALLAGSGVNAKILVLCRTDIFEVLEGANKNKIRQDSAIELDWYSDPAAPQESRLVEIANLRASIAFGSKTEVLKEFFPRRIFQKNAALALLDTTRHTPRDFLQLLKIIQSCSRNGKLDSDTIRNGIRKYSIEYFLPELVDELQGYVSGKEAKEFFKLAGSLRQRDFTAKQLYALAAEDPTNVLSVATIDTILRALFECSGIGNIQQRNGRDFFTFRYRNRHATFNIRERILLHRGLWRALNLPVDGSFDLDGSHPKKP